MLGDITVVPYNLQFIPLADDVISLENEQAFRELWVVCMQFVDTSTHTQHSHRMVMRLLCSTRHKLYTRCRNYMACSRE